MWSALYNPVVLMLLVAILTTLLKRASDFLGTSARSQIGARELQDSITVVAFVSERQSIEPYVHLRTTAEWPSRVRIHLFKSLSADEAVPQRASSHQVSLRLRYGSFDSARERARILNQESSIQTKYVLLLGDGAVDAVHGWDDVLVQMLAQCPSRHPVLTGIPLKPEVGHATSMATFLCISSSNNNNNGSSSNGSINSSLDARPFAVNPSRPQPSLFWTPAMSFGRADDLRLPDPRYLCVDNEALLGTQSMWMAGTDFYAPHVSVVLSLIHI